MEQTTSPTPTLEQRRQPRPKRVRTEAQNAAFLRAGGQQFLLRGAFADRVREFTKHRLRLAELKQDAVADKDRIRTMILEGCERDMPWVMLMNTGGRLREVRIWIKEHRIDLKIKRSTYLHRLP